MMKFFFLSIYYGFATYLPDSYSPIVGKISNNIRVFVCRQIFKKCGKKVIINRKTYFGNGSEIEIGDYSSIGTESVLPRDIIIGKYVMMAPQIHIVTNNHYFNRIDVPMCFQGSPKTYKRTVIEDDCWIGVRAIFTPERHLKKGTIVAAGAVVTKDFGEYSIIGGNPAKIIRYRE